MIRSMTGFARARRAGEWGEFTLELRSVNHRFLDIKFAMPELLRPLEETLRRQLRAGLARGRVEATVRIRFGDGSFGKRLSTSDDKLKSEYRKGAGHSHDAGTRLVVDHALAVEVVAAARELAAKAGMDAPQIPDTLRLLAWPGVVEATAPRIEALTPEFEALCAEAIAALVAAREREGEALAQALGVRLRTLIGDVERVQADGSAREPDLASRLADRLQALGSAVDADRVAQEAAILIVRQDVSEELDRLLAHARETERLLGSGQAVGRRLDFLIQELAREANTLASKAGSLALNRQALDFKVLIEEMREQVQNVE